MIMMLLLILMKLMLLNRLILTFLSSARKSIYEPLKKNLENTGYTVQIKLEICRSSPEVKIKILKESNLIGLEALDNLNLRLHLFAHFFPNFHSVVKFSKIRKNKAVPICFFDFQNLIKYAT